MANCSRHGALVALIVLSCFVGACCGDALFSSLSRTLVVTASPHAGEVLKAGEGTVTVTWSYNTTFPSGTDSDYKTVKLMLCYAPISQVDRAWRKTVDNLKKDKTCQHNIVSRPYARSNTLNNTFTYTYTIERDIPSATYFVRAYALDSEAKRLAYGQTTDAAKKANLFQIEAITGRHVSLDVASACFSAFSVLSLLGFFVVEKRKAKALVSN